MSSDKQKMKQMDRTYIILMLSFSLSLCANFVYASSIPCENLEKVLHHLYPIDVSKSDLLLLGINDVSSFSQADSDAILDRTSQCWDDYVSQGKKFTGVPQKTYLIKMYAASMIKSLADLKTKAMLSIQDRELMSNADDLLKELKQDEDTKQPVQPTLQKLADLLNMMKKKQNFLSADIAIDFYDSEAKVARQFLISSGRMWLGSLKNSEATSSAYDPEAISKLRFILNQMIKLVGDGESQEVENQIRAELEKIDSKTEGQPLSITGSTSTSPSSVAANPINPDRNRQTSISNPVASVAASQPISDKQQSISSSNFTDTLPDVLWKIVFYAVLILTATGIFLGLTKRVVFYSDYTDLMLSLLAFAVPLAMVYACTLLPFPPALSMTLAVVCSIAFMVRQSYLANNKNMGIALILVTSKLVLSMLYIVFLLGLNNTKRRKDRWLIILFLSILTPLMLALVHDKSGGTLSALKGRRYRIF